jgi:hypothetical protein
MASHAVTLAAQDFIIIGIVVMRTEGALPDAYLAVDAAVPVSFNDEFWRNKSLHFSDLLPF